MSDALPTLLTPGDVAAWLALPVARISRMARRGEIPSIALPAGELVFDRAELLAWLNGLRRSSTQATRFSEVRHG